jgi:hypothetical protein
LTQDLTISYEFIFLQILSGSDWKTPAEILQDSKIKKRTITNRMGLVRLHQII